MEKLINPAELCFDDVQCQCQALAYAAYTLIKLKMKMSGSCCYIPLLKNSSGLICYYPPPGRY